MSEMPMAGTLSDIAVPAGAAAGAEGDCEAGAEAEADDGSDALSGTGLGSFTARATWSALLSGSVWFAVSAAVWATGSGVASSAPVGWIALLAGCASAPESIPLLPARASATTASTATTPSAKRPTLPRPVPNNPLIARPLLLPKTRYAYVLTANWSCLRSP